MRVLHCIETLGSGGVERRRLSLARYLPESFTQALICSKSFGGLKQHLESHRVQVTEIGELGSIFNFFYYVRLVRAVRAFKPHQCGYSGDCMPSTRDYYRRNFRTYLSEQPSE